jgi:hypothetical protein
MVDIEYGIEMRSATLTAPQVLKGGYVVSKALDNTPFFKVSSITTGSHVPEVLRGHFSTLKKGVETVENYLKNLPPSKALERDQKYAKNHPKGSDIAEQGVDH